MKTFLLSVVIAALLIAGSVFIPPLFSFSGQYSLKGFPFYFYNPPGSDYGASFYPKRMVADFTIYLIIIFGALLALKKALRLRK